MGTNRAGARRTRRLKRAKREHARLAAKASAQQQGSPAEKPHSLGETVAGAARGLLNAVGGVIESAVETVTGKSS